MTETDSDEAGPDLVRSETAGRAQRRQQRQGQYLFPVAGPPSRRGFGGRRDPFTGRTRHHAGQDFRSSAGSRVRAVAAGKVVRVTKSCRSTTRSQMINGRRRFNAQDRACGGGFGNFVTIQHPDGNFSVYAHLQNGRSCPALANLRVGSTVRAGQAIACVGSSGNSTGPHLHFEIRVGGNTRENAVNPMPFLRRGQAPQVPRLR